MRVLTILSDGECHSGRALGEALGVSRAAVWKQLRSLENLGVEVQSHKGLGYSLVQRMELLDVEKIRAKLSLSVNTLLDKLELFPELASTNQHLLDCSNLGESIHFHCVSSERQTQGRGRRGRSWYSPFAENLYLSMGWRIENGVAAIEGLSLAVGVAACRALRRVGIQDAGLKWPNDILLDERKLGGVLIELSGDMSADCDVIVGVGLNVLMDSVQDDGDVLGAGERGEHSQIDQPWVSAQEVCADVRRNELLGYLIDELCLLLSSFESLGFSAYRQEWERLHVFQGHDVTIVSANNTASGVVSGVDSSGALILDTSLGLKSFHGGEVSLRASV